MSKREFDLMRVRIYLSGTTKDNGKIGGFSALMVADSEDLQIRRTISGHGENTSVTRMQLKAVESALLSIKTRQDQKQAKHPDKQIVKPIVEFYTNNAQVSAGLNKNIFNWSKNGWKTLKGELLQHADLWENIFYLLDNYVMSHRVKLQKVTDADKAMSEAIRHSLLIAENTSNYSMNKNVALNEESVIGSNVIHA